MPLELSLTCAFYQTGNMTVYTTGIHALTLTHTYIHTLTLNPRPYYFHTLTLNPRPYA